jgi:uncharacterized GH25 family protein
MSSHFTRLVLPSVFVLAAAAGIWLLNREPDHTAAADGRSSVAGKPTADTPASAALAAAAPPAAPAPMPAATRTALESSPSPATTYRLTGRLVAVRGEPVATEVGLWPATGIAMPLPRDLTELGRAPAKHSAHSGKDGRFAFACAAGKEWSLRLQDDAWFFVGENTAGARDALAIANLDADRDLGDIVVGRTAKIAGVVTNEAGKPQANVEVRVRKAGEGLLLDVANADKTDAAGAFARAGLLPGQYVITTASPDFLPGELTVTVRAGENRADVVVALRAGHVIAGRVVDDRGAPLPGMKVAADRARELAPGVQLKSATSGEATTTDAGGNFVLRGLDAGTVNVDAWGAGHVRGQAPNVTVGASDVVITLLRHAQVRGHVRDEAGTPVAGSRVFGEAVADDRVPPLPGNVDDVVTDAQGAFVLERVPPGSLRIVAEGDGHLRVASAPLDVQPGANVAGVEIVVKRGALLAVKVIDTAGQPVAGAKVTVTAEPLAEPQVPGVVQRSVRMQRRLGGGEDHVITGDEDQRGTATTGDDGVATITGLQPGRVVAAVAHERYAPARSAGVAIPETGRITTEVALVAGGFVQLQALDAAGAVLPRANYKLQGPFDAEASGTPTAKSGRCDAKGLARVGPLRPGRWKARLCLAAAPMEVGGGMSMMVFGDDGKEFPETETVIDVVAEQITAVTLTQPQLTTLRGTVTDAKGPVGGAKIRVQEDGALAMAGFGGGYSATSDASGAFALADLPAGKYTLRYGYADALAMSEEPLELVSGQALVERSLMLRTGTLRLIVHGEDGTGLAGAKVTLERVGQGSVRPQRREIRMVAVMRTDDNDGGGSTTSITTGEAAAKTDAEGRVEIARVPEGNYTLRVEHSQHVTGRKTDVKMLDGATLDLGTVRLAAGGELRGKVTGADGQTLGIARVEITAVTADGASAEPRQEMAMNGSYRATGLAAGRYRVRAHTVSGGAGAPGPSRASAPVDVEISKGERKALDLQVK